MSEMEIVVWFAAGAGVVVGFISGFFVGGLVGIEDSDTSKGGRE